jgi:hypothetical protein
MRDFINIGCTPLDEDCAQVGSKNYLPRAMNECGKFIHLLQKTFGPEPEGARLAIKSFPHDFGTYHEVVCWFDDDLPESVKYAYKLEAETPATWEG